MLRSWPPLKMVVTALTMTPNREIDSNPLNRDRHQRTRTMTAHEIIFNLLILCVACGAAGLVGCLLEHFIVAPILRRMGK